MATALVLFIALAGASSRAAEPAISREEIKVRLAEAEAGVAQLGVLATDAARAFKEPLPKKDSYRTTVTAGLSQTLAEECRRGFNLDTLLTPKDFPAYQLAIVPHLACKAGVAKSMGTCGVLSGVDALIKKCKDGSQQCLPQMECRRRAGMQILISALIRNSNDSSCPWAIEAFNDIPAPLRLGACQALFTFGTPSQICARQNKASGGANLPEDYTDCRALLALRGAVSARACADKNLSPASAAGCRAAFESGKDPSCSASRDVISAKYCGDVAAVRMSAMGKEIGAEAERLSNTNPRIAALEAFKKKHTEVESLLTRIAATDHTAYAARLRKARTAAAEAVKRLQAAVRR